MSGTMVICLGEISVGRTVCYLEPIKEYICVRMMRRVAKLWNVLMSDFVISSVPDIVCKEEDHGSFCVNLSNLGTGERNYAKFYAVSSEFPSIQQIYNKIFDSMKRERFAKRFIPDHTEMGRVTLPRLAADICAFSGSVKPEISKGSMRHKTADSATFGKVMAENPSNSKELSKLSLFLALDLWRDKRHRRRCDADFRTVH